MKTLFLAVLCLGAVLGLNASASEKATVGQTAPDFTLIGADGKSHSLSDYKGKFIVLEWTNPGCPFVHKFYDSGTMQALQKQETAKGVAWLRINSNAAGKEGHEDVAALDADIKANHVAATQSLLDPDGKVGHLYGARTTPNMFVIDNKGTLIYAGAIDDKPSTDPADIPTATNYVTAALDAAMAGQPVKTPTAPSYGCAVKYASH
jgi:peroxiredoxin